MNIDDVVTRACDRIPGLVRGALVMLPEGFLLGAAGGATILDLEPMIRAASRCLALRSPPALDGLGRDVFVEYLFVVQDQLVVIQGSRRDPRLSLVAVSTREANLAFVLSTTRLALADVEATIDLTAWGL